MAFSVPRPQVWAVYVLAGLLGTATFTRARAVEAAAAAATGAAPPAAARAADDAA